MTADEEKKLTDDAGGDVEGIESVFRINECLIAPS